MPYALNGGAEMTSSEARRYYTEHLRSKNDRVADVDVYQILDETIAAFVLVSKTTHVVWRETYIVDDNRLHYETSKLLYP